MIPKDLHDFDDVAENYDLYLEVMHHTEGNFEGLLDFYLDFARAMLIEFPEVEKVARIILVEKGLFDDVKIKFSK